MPPSMVLGEVATEQIDFRERLKRGQVYEIDPADGQLKSGAAGGVWREQVLIKLAVSGNVVVPFKTGFRQSADGVDGCVRVEAVQIAVQDVGRQGPGTVSVRIKEPGVGDGDVAQEDHDVAFVAGGVLADERSQGFDGLNVFQRAIIVVSGYPGADHGPTVPDEIGGPVLPR